MMSIEESGIPLAQQAAQDGQRPHEIVRILRVHFARAGADRIPLLPIEGCLVRAFAIPLRTARDIELWTEFNDQGHLTNDDIDTLFHPWIVRYCAQHQ